MTEKFCTLRRSAPASSRCVAKLCRSLCGVSDGSSPAAIRYFSTSAGRCARWRCPPVRSTNSGPLALRARSSKILLQRHRWTASAQRRQSLLLAFAANAHNLTEHVHVIIIELDQLVNAQPGAVKRLQNRFVTPRRRPVFPSSFNGASSSASICWMVRNFGSRRPFFGSVRPTSGLCFIRSVRTSHLNKLRNADIFR